MRTSLLMLLGTLAVPMYLLQDVVFRSWLNMDYSNFNPIPLPHDGPAPPPPSCNASASAGPPPDPRAVHYANVDVVRFVVGFVALHVVAAIWLSVETAIFSASWAGPKAWWRPLLTRDGWCGAQAYWRRCVLPGYSAN
jgi:hypothetical protein